MHPNQIRQTWEERVKNQYVFRGMSYSDLSFPLNPAISPFSSVAPLITRFLDIVEKMVNNGTWFDIIETHFGNIYRHNLNNIISWTRRDLNRPGIDFTSRYQSAREYSDCWQGSQLKQNIKTICENLLENSKVKISESGISKEEEKTVLNTAAWVTSSCNHKPIVLHIHRGLDLFGPSDRLLPLGSLP